MNICRKTHRVRVWRAKDVTSPHGRRQRGKGNQTGRDILLVRLLNNSFSNSIWLWRWKSLSVWYGSHGQKEESRYKRWKKRNKRKRRQDNSERQVRIPLGPIRLVQRNILDRRHRVLWVKKKIKHFSHVFVQADFLDDSMQSFGWQMDGSDRGRMSSSSRQSHFAPSTKTNKKSLFDQDVPFS